MAQIEAVRVAQDAAYAASLTDADWYALAQDPIWQEMVAEQSEMVSGVMAQYGHKLPFANGSTNGSPQAAPAAAKAVGADIARIQGLGIVTNLGQYTENIRMPGMLFMRTLRSRYPHARILSVDASKAEKLPGVVKILHRENLPNEYKDVFVGAQNPTRFLFNQEVYEVGAPIAVVAAESEHIADEAIRQIDVKYEVLPAALDMLEAMKATTQKQWTGQQLDGTTIAITAPLVRGDLAAARADVTVENVSRKSTEQHVALELTNSLSYWDGDKLNVYYTNQHAHGSRSGLANALKIPQNKVRVVQTGYLGSGYGYRSGIDLAEAHGAILAKLTGRPVRNNYTRYEDFVTRTHRPEFRNEMKLGVNRDGTIQSGHFKVIANVGAQRAGAANGAWFHFQMTYKIPNLRLEGTDVMTNSYKSGPYRCVSHPNGTFALETIMDKAAYAIGMDPVEFRLKNLNETGNPDTRRPFSNPGVRDVIVATRDAIGWKDKFHAPKAKQVRPGVFHGIGFAAHSCSHGAGGNPSTGQVIINSDGSVQAITGATDIGSGQRTHMLQIAADALGVTLNQITITPYVDTDNTTDTGGTFGSRQTNSGGRGVYEAGVDARNQVLAWAARKFTADFTAAKTPRDVKPADVDMVDGVISLKDDAKKTLKLSDVVGFKGTAIHGKSEYVHDNLHERTAWAAAAAEVEVDTVTGSVKVTKYVAAHDVGKAINPFSLRQQIEGGVVMAAGAVFTEELLIDKATGLPLNPNLLDYRPLSIKDAPLAEVILIEKPKAYGVFGAHGIGEPPMGPPAPAIVNAVYNAVGVWVLEQPLTREKLLAALKAG